MLTKLGWVLLGGNNNKTEISLNHITSDRNLENLVERFWDIEGYGTVSKRDPKVLPKSDKCAVDILAKTTKKENNRYSVGLLWKEDTVTLPNNRSLAISRMISLEKKFGRQPDLKMKYVETINQYIKDGHVTKIDINKRNDNFNNKVNYIPHHAMTNINKPGKICIVFDAGAKCQSTSFNENLLKGPDLLNNLVGVLLRFRQGKFCVMTDIEKIFHQVMVDLRDRDALRFIWRKIEVRTFKMFK